MDETVYRGITFRSKLEAQWAVFFDVLGIIYRYETKAHVHEDVSILPSFYLPQYQCFVLVIEDFLTSSEVSDEEEEILEAMKLLTLYEGKETYSFTGNVWLPGEPDGYEIHRFQLPTIWTHLAEEMLGGDSTEEVPASIMVKVILQKLEDCSLRAVVRNLRLSFHSTKYIYQTHIERDMKEYLEYMPYQHECLTEIAPLIIEHYHDLVTVLTPKQGMEVEFLESSLNEMPTVWAECSECGDIALMLHWTDENLMLHQECPSSQKGIYKVNASRLLRAYASARKKDFEKYSY